MAQALPATGPGGRGGSSSAAGRRRGENEEEGCGEGPGPRAEAGSGRLEEAPSPAGEEGLPREPSPETPDDDDDDDDEEEDDMAARLGFSLGLGCGQEPSSQPPSGPRADAVSPRSWGVGVPARGAGAIREVT
jgi:hypothetical protein